MIELYSGFNVITEEIDNKFIVVLIDKKNYNKLFEFKFTVYSNYDSKGLIEDAVGIYKRTISQ